MSAASERLVCRIEAIDTEAAENRGRAEAYDAMRTELKDVTAEVAGSGGDVVVVAAPGGVIKDIRFTDAVRELDPEALATRVRAAIARAQVEVARRQAEIVRAHLGSTELLDRVLAYDTSTFGAPTADELATRAEAPTPCDDAHGDEPGDDDFFESFRVLKR